MTFGEQNSLSQSFDLLSQAFHSGINFFDSAEMCMPFPLSFVCVKVFEFGVMFGQFLNLGIRCLSVLRLRGRVRSTLVGGLGRLRSLVIALSWRPRFIFSFSLHYSFPGRLRCELLSFQGFPTWLNAWDIMVWRICGH